MSPAHASGPATPDPTPAAAGPTRRSVLALGGLAFGALALPLGLPQWAAAATDPYAALRTAWAGYLSGGAIDPTNPVYAPALAGLSNLAQAYLGSVQTGAGSGSLWADLPLGAVSANITSTFGRLRTLALAYVTPGTGCTGSATLARTVAAGLDFMTAGAYAPAVAPYNNWWDWQIGSSQALGDTAVLMYGQLTAAQIASYCACIDAFVPDPTKQLIIGSGSTTSTGANRLDECRAVIVRGALGGSGTKIAAGVAALSPALPDVIYGDGLYADGSFQQHGGVAYTGTYGAIFFTDIVALVLMLQGSAWAVTDSDLAQVLTGVANGFVPVVHNGLMLDAVRGRAVSRYNETDASDGFAAAITLLNWASASTDSAQAASWQSVAKGWLQRNTVVTVASTTSAIVNNTTGATVTVSGASVASVALAESVLGNSSIAAAPEPTVHQQFPNMARAVHRRPGWAYALSMCSRSVQRYEVINGENLHGWYTGDGMGYLYLDSDISQFDDAFWDTVNAYQLPGTTVDTGTLANSAGATTKPNTTWVGGSVLAGSYGAVGMQLQACSTDLTAVKSWFCLDDAVVALGAGITSTSGNPVVTVVENRNLHAGGSATLSINGTAQSTAPGWTSTVSGVHHASVGGVAGYCFLWPTGANNVQFALTEQTGNWSSVNSLAPTTLADDSRPYLSIVCGHGADPSGATYSYVLLPGATEARTAAYSAAPPVSVLANTPQVQAITDSALGVTMANFFAAGTAGTLTVNAPASVSTQTSGTTLTIAVADPSWSSATVQVGVSVPGYTSVVSADPTVTVLSTSGGSVQLLVETGGSRGASHSVTLSGTGAAPAPATATLLAPTDNAYVRGGSYASQNFAGSTTMAVKNSTGAYDRIALLKFSTAAISGTVARAILWVNGYVADSGGSQTGLTAYGTSTDSWTEAAVTFTDAPALTTAYGSGQLSDTADWVGLDVTALVAAGADGLASVGVSQPSAGLAVLLATKEGSAATAPVLQVITH